MSPATASWEALGTTASLAVTDEEALAAARVAVEAELAEVDAACSRFRPDAELARLNKGAGAAVSVGPVLFEAVEVALRAARATGGLVDPTVGAGMDAIGYDRDFSAIPENAPPIVPAPAAGWRSVVLDPERRTVQLLGGGRLDLGATAKAWAADRCAARAAAAAPGAGVLVSLGGDIAIAGSVPAEGWPVAIADDHAEDAFQVTVALTTGGLATSSTTVRRWVRGGREVHHILDPATGKPAPVHWRTVSVTAATCVDANTASTAAIVMGAAAEDWLARAGLPARLVAADGHVVTIAGWPAEQTVAA